MHGHIRLMVCLAAGALIVPHCAAGEPPFAAKSQVIQALEEGFEIGAKHAEAANALLDQARKAAPGDPRVFHASGLIQFKQLKPVRAVAEFERAAKARSDPYWPAWQAWTWLAFRDRKMDEGLTRLEQLITTAALQPDDESVHDIIHWAGQVLGAVQRTETDAESQEKLMQAEARLREQLDDILEEVFDEGLLSLNELEDRLRDRSDASSQAAAARSQKALKAEQAKLDATLAKVTERKEEVKRSADEWKTWLDGEVAKFDKQLTSLEKDYNFLLQRKTSLEQSIALVGREITALENSRNPNASPQAQNALVDAIGQRRMQMINYENDHSATTLRIYQTAQAGTAIVAQKRASVQQYEQATGTLADAKAKADKWTDRLAARKTRLKPKTTVAKTESKPVITFVSFVPFDLEASRDQLLKDIE
jgi:hypothetical protein